MSSTWWRVSIAPVLVEARPVGVGAPHDDPAPFGERVGDRAGSRARRRRALARADGEVLVVEEQRDAFVVAGHWPSLDVLVLWPVNDKVYIHEFIDIIGHNRANYMHHMTANFSPDGAGGPQPALLRRVGRRRHDAWVARGAQPLGGARLRRPGHVVPLRARSLDACRTRSSRSGGPRRRTTAVTATTACWSRRRGRRTIDELCADGVQGETYAHEQIHVPMGTVARLPRGRRRGGRSRSTRSSAGSSPARGRPRWSTSRSASCSGRSRRGSSWAETEKAERMDSALQRWRKRTYELSEKWHRFLVVDAPLSPMRIGRQPARSRPRRGLGRPVDRSSSSLVPGAREHAPSTMSP